MKLPRIMLAGVSSGSGKTLLTCGLLEALKQKGYRAGAFKCGPDYIDPMFHRAVLETDSCNLDPWFCDGPMLRWLLGTKGIGADICVLEGVMGYYDGLGGTSDRASAYEVARETNTPVILVVDARGMSKSLVPLVKGFADYRTDSGIVGVIFNRMNSHMYPLIRRMAEDELAGEGIRVLGYVPELSDTELPGRHLGLVLPEEVKNLKEKIQKLGAVMAETLDMEGILQAAESAASLEETLPDQVRLLRVLAEEEKRDRTPVRIGVAKDAAFCFLYPENLEVLAAFGAEPVFFSPLEDKTLPEGISGLLLCGGYPELHAGKLEGNAAMRAAVREALLQGMPCLAECGGFLYLQETLKTADGADCQMAGVLKGEGFPAGRLVRFGYVRLSAEEENLYLSEGEEIRGHEFHYWDSTENGQVFAAHKASGRGSTRCMRQEKRILAGFPHLYYYSQPALAKRFIRLCREYEKERAYADSIDRRKRER